MTQLFVNARFLTQDVTGVQRYAIEICKRLKTLRPETRFVTPKGVRQGALAEQLGAEITGRLSGHAWEQLELPLLTRGGALLSLCNTGPLLHPRQVVTLHDAAVFAVPEAYSKTFRIVYTKLFQGLKHGTKILVTDSQFSQSELSHYLRLEPERINVIYLGAEHSREATADPNILEQHNLRERPYLLAVGSSSPHKNFARLVRALISLGEQNTRVVLAGGTNPRVHSPTGELPSSAVHVGYVSDGELRSLYENAAGFIHPAYYEGFGLPPLEAMALGCPVLCSYAASLPEVCGDAALYFDPFNEADIAAKIRRFVGDPALQKKLREKGQVQARKFSWDRTVRAVLERVEATL